MKRMNEKGFTLIELLAVIIILGVLLLVAIPSMDKVITDAKKDSYLTTEQHYISAARYMGLNGSFDFPAIGEAIVIKQSLIQLSQGGKRSPFDADWETEKSYILITATGSVDNPTYTYYVAAVDKGNSGITLTSELALKRGDFFYKSASKASGIQTISQFKTGITSGGIAPTGITGIKVTKVIDSEDQFK